MAAIVDNGTTCRFPRRIKLTRRGIHPPSWKPYPFGFHGLPSRSRVAPKRRRVMVKTWIVLAALLLTGTLVMPTVSLAAQLA